MQYKDQQHSDPSHQQSSASADRWRRERAEMLERFVSEQRSIRPAERWEAERASRARESVAEPQTGYDPNNPYGRVEDVIASYARQRPIETNEQISLYG